MRARIYCLLLITSVIARGSLHKFSSGPTQVHLIELYTSEGCSSCPPAEAWLNRLRQAPGLWRNFVPVAFHVDYWNRLGWPDRFSRRQFTDRQYHYGSIWGVSTVYTPGFVLNGRDWRERSGRMIPAPGGRTGMLTVEIADGRFVVSFEPASVALESYVVHVVLLGGGFVSQVKAGENRGETLQHEFVALALDQHALSGGRGDFPLPVTKITDVMRHALAVWITRKGSTEPLQATGGWLD